MPPTTETFSEVYLGKQYSRKVESFGHWNIHFQQHVPSLVKFNYSLPEGASIGIYGRRNGIPTHTRYDFVEILDTRKKDKSKRSAKVINIIYMVFCLIFLASISFPQIVD